MRAGAGRYRQRLHLIVSAGCLATGSGEYATVTLDLTLDLDLGPETGEPGTSVSRG